MIARLRDSRIEDIDFYALNGFTMRPRYTDNLYQNADQQI
jgi:hypothetical protein